MKLKNVFLLGVVVTSTAVFSQNQNNKIDSTGNIGIGILNPSNKLEVNGKTRLDSTLEVRDSATFRRRVRIKEDVIIHGKTFMRDNGVANQNFRVQNGFRVDGISRFYNNVFADSTLRVGKLGLFENNVRVNGQLRTYGINNLFGISRFHDEVRLLNLTDTSGQNEDGFMMLSGNGLVKRADFEWFDTTKQVEYLYGVDSDGEMSKIRLGDVDQWNRPIDFPCRELPGSFASIPSWASDTGVIWTGDPCPAKVGIGTDNPYKDLHIKGPGAAVLLQDSDDWFTFQAANGYGRIINDGSVSIFLDSDDSENNAVFRINSNSDYFGGNMQDILRLYENGKLTIKSAQTGDKILQLKTNGTLLTRRVKINMDTWPDYVFDEKYDLLPVEELETFIHENHHLPNVPSEAKVKEEGVDLGQMDKVLLEKVEELTLYMIEQQKEIKKLKEEIRTLKEGGQ